MTTPTPYAPPLDFSGVIPPEFSTQIIEEAVRASSALQLGNLMPMGTTITELPIPKTLPTASFVSVGGRKPWTDIALQTATLHAEEIAAITAIPDAYLEDGTINLWEFVRPRIAEAIGVALDAAVFWGVGAPASYPVGGVNAVATAVAAGVDAVDTINQAMAAVEAGGISVTGQAADITVRSTLRGVRAAGSGELLLGTVQAGDVEQPTLYGIPISYNTMTQHGGTNADYFAGDFRNLFIGVRQDIRYMLDPSAVIADNTGAVLISGFQDNQTPLKVWARFGCAIVKPVTVRSPAGANPFSKAALVGKVTPTETGDEPRKSTSSAKS
jgi:HK97 family phage major capsid protein